jgi:hypothetical protein
MTKVSRHTLLNVCGKIAVFCLAGAVVFWFLDTVSSGLGRLPSVGLAIFVGVIALAVLLRK